MDGVHEIDGKLQIVEPFCVAVFAVVWSVLGAVCEEVALFAKAAKFVVFQERVGFLRFLVIS